MLECSRQRLQGPVFLLMDCGFAEMNREDASLTMSKQETGIFKLKFNTPLGRKNQLPPEEHNGPSGGAKQRVP